VLLTQLCKYDGSRTRLLSAREFHQVAGRAWRAGYDVAGTVWAQAPEHVIDNERALAKADEAGRKRRKVVRSKPPERGFVPWNEDTFIRLTVAEPETLESSFAVTHALLLNVLDRPAGGVAALKRLLRENHDPRPAQRRHVRRAVAIARSLLGAGVIERVDGNHGGVEARVAVDLQANFALNQPLSPFVLEALGHLDPDAATYALDVLSLVEATLENPSVILAAQLSKLKGEVLSELKAQGMDYDERMAILESLEHPKPLRELTYELFDAYRLAHPWVEDHNIAPKSVARDLYERAMTFTDYVGHYGLARAEGLVLRYLGDAYKGLVQTVPEEAKTDEVADLTAWLGETVRQVDSSLLDEWDRIRSGAHAAVDEAPAVLVEAPPGITANPRAFRVMVRNRLFHHVESLARRAYNELASAGPGDERRWEAAMGPYWDRHESLGTGAPARGGALFQVREEAGWWTVRQVLDDPAGDHDWALVARVDLAASDRAGAPAVELLGVEDAVDLLPPGRP
jgi:hypothetical protein